MKSSTIRRSNLSKETMEVIENLSKEQSDNETLNEYVRPGEEQNVENSSKSQEIDLLWQNFKSAQFNTNSPSANMILGFILGVISTLIVGAFINNYLLKSDVNLPFLINSGKASVEATLEQQADTAQQEISDKVNLPADNKNDVDKGQAISSDQKSEKYIVKSGDTVEGIIRKIYGSYSPEKAEMIMKVNNLENLDMLQIDQELLIPVE